MATISGYDSNSIGTLLSSLGNSRTSNAAANNFGINLGDYNTIKSGSYFKLLKSYYSTEGTSGYNAVKKAQASTSTSEDSTKTLASVKSAGDSVSSAAKDLYSSNSLFSKKTTKNEDGTSTTDYDRDAIYDKVSDFVSSYNSLIKATDSVNTSSIARSSSAMITNTKANESTLKSIGITVDSDDFTLKIDKDKFKSADMSKVESLFKGTGSYAYSTAVRASMISSYAETESSKSNTYSSNGKYSYNYNNGDIFSSFM